LELPTYMANFVLMETPNVWKAPVAVRVARMAEMLVVFEKMFGIHVTSLAQSMLKDSIVERGY
jgi:hypothetical protein